MDTVKQNLIKYNDSSSYILYVVGVVAIIKIIRYSYLIDIWLSKDSKAKFEGKPWPLLSGIFMGFLIYIFEITTPGGLLWNFEKLNWKEYSVVLTSIFVVLGIIIESIKHYNGAVRYVRMIIWVVLTMACVIAGLYTGLFITLLLVISIIVYFIFFWKKRMKITNQK